tara:strand:+ start:236 stop:469 length:234 start_codon:yes stop_codon:yes gene_type:complete
MKEQLVRSLLAHAHGEINYHKANVDVYLNHPAGIGEHPDVMGAISDELDKIAKYHDQVEVLKKYFLMEVVKGGLDEE